MHPLAPRSDPTVKIPWVRPDLCGPRMLVMEWIDGVRCTNPDAIRSSPGIVVDEFIKCGVVSGLRQLLEVGGMCGLTYTARGGGGGCTGGG